MFSNVPPSPGIDTRLRTHDISKVDLFTSFLDGVFLGSKRFAVFGHLTRTITDIGVKGHIPKNIHGFKNRSQFGFKGLP